jgi:dTMP kinase
MTNRRGTLIVFEGIDGCGKSTQAELLAQRLAAKGLPHRFVREPGTTAVAEAVRQILLHAVENPLSPETEMFLYLAARADLYRHLVLPALDAGETVVSDRCFWSTVAYQGAGLGLGVERARELCLLATAHREPDLVFLLDLAPEQAARRRSGPADRIEGRGAAYAAGVREAFLELARRAADRTAILDGARPVDRLHRTIVARTEGLLEVTL